MGTDIGPGDSPNFLRSLRHVVANLAMMRVRWTWLSSGIDANVVLLVLMSLSRFVSGVTSFIDEGCKTVVVCL